jgi:hypothetical protein
MGTYRVQVCRRVWETAYIDIDDAVSADDALAQAEQYLEGGDEDGLDWATSGADSEPKVEGVTDLASSRPN